MVTVCVSFVKGFSGNSLSETRSTSERKGSFLVDLEHGCGDLKQIALDPN